MSKSQTRVRDVAWFAVIIWLMVRGVQFVIWNVKNVWYFMRNRKRR